MNTETCLLAIIIPPLHTNLHDKIYSLHSRQNEASAVGVRQIKWVSPKVTVHCSLARNLCPGKHKEGILY